MYIGCCVIFSNSTHVHEQTNVNMQSASIYYIHLLSELIGIHSVYLCVGRRVPCETTLLFVGGND